jgi:hypothetical protein
METPIRASTYQPLDYKSNHNTTRTHYPAPSQVEFGSRPISWLQALDIIECLDPIFHAGLVSGTINWKEVEDIIKSDPDLHARIVKHARTEPVPPSEPLLISPRNTEPEEIPWEAPRIRGDHTKLLALLARYQSSCPDPSSNKIARAEKAFAHMLFWGPFVDVKPGCYQSLGS